MANPRWPARTISWIQNWFLFASLEDSHERLAKFVGEYHGKAKMNFSGRTRRTISQVVVKSFFRDPKLELPLEVEVQWWDPTSPTSLKNFGASMT